MSPKEVLEVVAEIGDIVVACDEHYVSLIVDSECVLFMDRDRSQGLGSLLEVLSSLVKDDTVISLPSDKFDEFEKALGDNPISDNTKLQELLSRTKVLN